MNSAQLQKVIVAAMNKLRKEFYILKKNRKTNNEEKKESA